MELLNLKKEILPEHNKKNIGIHTYPAKMVNHIPSYFLSLEENKKSVFVLDPFCGSGTVLKEASKRNMSSYGIDINPLARLISKVETNSLNKRIVLEKLNKIKDIFYKINPEKVYFPNIDYWFSKKTQEDLFRLRKAIKDNN